MAEQVRGLREAARQPNVTVQGLHFDAGACLGVGNASAILAFPDPGDADVVLLSIGLPTNWGGELYLEDPAEICGYVRVFDHLRAAALGPEKSMEIIISVEKELAGR
ncbi:Scr1 family TA system antitoxin-like transcriptional regulator [Microbispora amethystogenes]|uniref:DUF5753 domain-containing protein n=1 Tax=Microbispora amethystogenes TaxID=1427754 RepID=A0ABQ4FG20_9ACTN|nr:Scr1 family TA system antitoxin-like transcriptional regulator [Microbispora amethystogenes]GIH33762.1 hypothetical protein Mam01_39260 [Microbispora amethystogenes]